MKITYQDILPTGVLLLTLVMLFSSSGPLKVWQSKILAPEPTQAITLGGAKYQVPKAWVIKETSWTLPSDKKIETRAIPSNQATQEILLKRIEDNIKAKHVVISTKNIDSFKLFQLDSGKTILVLSTSHQLTVFSGTNQDIVRLLQGMESVQ